VSEVIYEKRGHIAHIKLNRPERLNAMSRSSKLMRLLKLGNWTLSRLLRRVCMLTAL
jgi:1,4-dihydroxy-2-naphthoyl-CoA synthase